MYSSTDLVNNAILGKLWLFKKCSLCVPLQFDDNIALYESVKYGRTSIVKYILENGGNPNSRGVLSLACLNGFTHIVNLLLQHGSDVHYNNDEALISAVKGGHTACVKFLLDHGANVHIKDDLCLIEACKNKHINIIKILLQSGADPDAMNGSPILDAIEKNNTDIIDILISAGADVSICDDAPLSKAADKKNIPIMVSLINNGADRNILDTKPLNETTFNIINAYTKKSYIKRLANAIHDSFEKHDFKWQTLCSRKDPDIYLLRKQAELFGLDIATDKSKTILCTELAIKYENERNMRIPVDPADTDFSGTPINDLPFWKIFKIENTIFNIFDLLKMIRQGIMINPYTRNPLPIESIKARENFLRKILTRAKFSDKNLIEIVKNTPLPTEEMAFRSQLESNVWDYFVYAPSISLVTDATDKQIDEMMEKLKTICKRKSIFDIMTNGSVDIYPMLSETTVKNVKKKTGLAKKKEFGNLLRDIVKVRDEHTDTRIMAISIMLKYVSDNAQNIPTDIELPPFEDNTLVTLENLEILQYLIWTNDAQALENGFGFTQDNNYSDDEEIEDN